MDLPGLLVPGLFEFVRVHGEVVGGEGRRCLHCQLRGGQQRQVLQQSHEVSYTIHRAINVCAGGKGRRCST
eukprot:1140250-Pelagomonas_calceolata.AAC.9